MRTVHVMTTILMSTLVLSGCEGKFGADPRTADISVDAIDGTGLSDIMLNTSDPNEAVAYFSRASSQKPDRIDLQRNLAKSLVRAKQPEVAVATWQQVVAHKDATMEDRVDYADALIRTGNWDAAEAQLNTIPPTYETYRRYRLEAMVADSKQNWSKADSFYQTAAGLTTKPAGVLNNWGYSKLTRGQYQEAEKLFARAVTYDPSLFTAKNNLVLARGAQRKYDLPVMNMTQIERAQLLYTLGLAAVKAGDVATGRGLIKEAIDTHPQHFDAAVRSLRALEANVTN